MKGYHEMAGNSKQDKPATETDESMNGTIIQDTRSRLTRITNLMAQEATAGELDNEFYGDDILAIFEAETEAEMWDADTRGPLSSKDLTGCELEIHQVDVKYSRRNDIKSMFVTTDDQGNKRYMYLMVQAVRTRHTGDENRKIKLPEVGEMFQFDTSARFVVAKLLWLYVHGHIDPQKGLSKKLRVVGIDLGGDQVVVKLAPVAPVQATATVA